MKEDKKIIFTSKERRMLKWMRKSLSEVELAAKFHVSVTTIRRWLDGTNSLSYAIRIMVARESKKMGGPNI